jgi:chromate reductase, NAD(P)H dehydrogenase (quinone)
MARLSVGVIVGSARNGSINQKLAEALMKLGGPEVEFKQLKIDDLPLFSQDLEEPVPPSVERFRKEIRASDGLLFVTPEYNRSITPLLLNAISWGSRPYGHNSFHGKPGTIAGTSAGVIRTAAAQAHLRDILSVVDVRLITQPEAYVHWTDDLVAEDGSIPDEKQRATLKKKVDSLTEWVAQVAGAKEKKAA